MIFFFFVLYKIQRKGYFQYWKSGFSIFRISGTFTHANFITFSLGMNASCLSSTKQENSLSGGKNVVLPK